MSEGQSVADLLLKIGVDAGEMISGFNGTARQARQMAKDMAEGINASLQKAFDPATVDSGRILEGLQTKFTAARKQLQESSQQTVAVTQEEAARRQELINVYNQERSAARELTAEKKRLAQETDNASAATVRSMSAFDQMFQNLETQYRATVSTMLRESIQARAVIERSVANINQAASESMIAGMTKVGGVQFDPMISMLNAAAAKQKQLAAEQAEQAIQDELLQRQNLINSYNTEQRELRETADAIRRNEEDYAGLVQQMRDAEAAGRRLSTARRLDAKDAEAAVRINQAGADQAAEALRRRASDEEDARRRTAAIMASERLAARNRTNAAREQADLDRRALTLRRSLITAQDAHNERLEEYNTLLRTARISQEEFNEAVRRSEQVMNSQRAGSSQMAGILAQLSFGLEDFAQGIAMGDLRAAMLGASNNMTMVVRGLMDMSAASRTALVSTLAIPGAIALIGGTVVGLYAYTQWLHSATRDTRTLSDAIRDAQLGLEKFNKTAEFQFQMRGMETSVSRMTSLEDVARREQDLINERIDAERNLQNVQREAAVEAQAMIDNMLGGAEARAELEKFITRTKVQGSQAEVEAAREIERLVAQSQEAARQGNAETVINNLRKVYELLNAGALDISDDLIADLTALDALEEFFQTNRMSFGFLGEQFRLAEEDADKLRELRERLLATNEKLTEAEREQQKIAAELINLEIKRQELAKLRSEEMERQAKWAAAEQDQKQKEELFLIKATEHEKELFRLRQEQQKFVGEQNMQLMGLNPAANFGAMMQLGVQQVEAQADAMAFLEAQKQAAEVEIAALMQQTIPKAQGALEQDAFQAQADAFKQMTENLTQKPNPQLTQVVNRLGAIEAAIKNGGAFLQVGP